MSQVLHYGGSVCQFCAHFDAGAENISDVPLSGYKNRKDEGMSLGSADVAPGFSTRLAARRPGSLQMSVIAVGLMGTTIWSTWSNYIYSLYIDCLLFGS